MEKRGQLGIIEFKYFIVGLIVGIIGGLVLIILGNKKVIPFQIPMVCGFFKLNKKSWLSKKGQLGMIEFQYFIVGFIVGIVLALVLTYLGTMGIIPFKIPMVC